MAESIALIERRFQVYDVAVELSAIAESHQDSTVISQIERNFCVLRIVFHQVVHSVLNFLQCRRFVITASGNIVDVL